MITIYNAPTYPKNVDQFICELISNPKNFSATLLHKGRNSVWLVKDNNKEIVIKDFGHGLKSKLIYTLKKSKAERSLNNAIELGKRGIATPQPIAFAESRNSIGMLLRSWYIYEYEKSISYLEAKELYGHTLIAAFAEFVADLHNKGILHNDLNNTNVRVNLLSRNRFLFSLIDLNRMVIYPSGEDIALHDCMNNVCRFCSINDEFEEFTTHYLNIRNLPESLLNKMISIKKKHDNRDSFRHNLKRMLRK